MKLYSERLAELAKLKEALADRDAKLADKDAELAEQGAKLADKDALLAEKDRMISDLLRLLEQQQLYPLRCQHAFVVVRESLHEPDDRRCFSLIEKPFLVFQSVQNALIQHPHPFVDRDASVPDSLVVSQDRVLVALPVQIDDVGIFHWFSFIPYS